jgi:hypothetical protein
MDGIQSVLLAPLLVLSGNFRELALYIRFPDLLRLSGILSSAILNAILSKLKYS